MKHKPGEKQLEILLSRPAGQTHLAPLKSENSGLNNGSGRAILETVTGLFLGIPLGAVFYYVTLGVYYPILLCLLFAGSGIGAAVHIPNASHQGYVQNINFGPFAIVLLAVIATGLILFFTRTAMRQGYRIFAWVQLPLLLCSFLALLYLTLVYHKPLLPFYGQ